MTQPNEPHVSVEQVDRDLLRQLYRLARMNPGATDPHDDALQLAARHRHAAREVSAAGEVEAALKAADDILEGYVIFLHHMPSDDLELHPYIPVVEDAFDKVRGALNRLPAEQGWRKALIEAVGKPEDWHAKRQELYDWTGSAWLAGEEASKPPAGLGSFLCELIGWLTAGEDAARLALPLAPLPAAPADVEAR